MSSTQSSNLQGEMKGFPLTDEEKFNVEGALSVIGLMGYSKITERLRLGDWTVMNKVIPILKKGIVNKEDKDEDEQEAVDAYFELLGRMLGVLPFSSDEIPFVLQNLLRKADKSEEMLLKVLQKNVAIPNGCGYFQFLGLIASYPITNNSYFSYCLMKCSELVLKDLTIEVGSSDEEDEEDDELFYNSINPTLNAASNLEENEDNSESEEEDGDSESESQETNDEPDSDEKVELIDSN